MSAINFSQNPIPKPFLISVEGDIGAGKSTLIESLKKSHPNWHFIDEPVGTWLALKNNTGENLLELFYKDQARYSYTFQNCAILSRAINIQRCIESWQKECQMNPEAALNNVFVTERCLETDYYVFAKMLYDDGKMDNLEWDLYKMWYNYVKTLSYPLDLIVHVRTPPQVCANRILSRGRKGEEHIPLEYLMNLEKYQNTWLYGDEIQTPVMSYINYESPEKNHTPEDVYKKIQTYIADA